MTFQWRWNASTTACLLLSGSFAWVIAILGMIEIAIPFGLLGVDGSPFAGIINIAIPFVLLGGAGSVACWWFGQEELSQRAEYFIGALAYRSAT